MNRQVIDWLLEGDVSIQYLTRYYLLGEDNGTLRNRMIGEGWIGDLLRLQGGDGHWGQGYYRPKFGCTHYTLLELKNARIPREIPSINALLDRCLDEQKSRSGGVTFWKSMKTSDVCVDGMFLNYTVYFLRQDDRLNSVIDRLLAARMKDGGWNCRFEHKATHSSFHTTTSVLEGLWEYLRQGNSYRADEVTATLPDAVEFLLQHHLFQSHQTGHCVDPLMLKLVHPSHWRHDILRCLLLLVDMGQPRDPRIDEAMDILRNKRNPDGTWCLEHRHTGKNHQAMEKIGHPSRWITLKAMRVFGQYADNC